jgi:hypothetical protein
MEDRIGCDHPHARWEARAATATGMTSGNADSLMWPMARVHSGSTVGAQLPDVAATESVWMPNVPSMSPVDGRGGRAVALEQGGFQVQSARSRRARSVAPMAS